jgi:hypothetical protein
VEIMKDVSQERREELDQAWEPTHNPRFKPKTPSELNYRITTVIRSYLGDAPNATVEDMLAVLSDVRSEVAESHFADEPGHRTSSQGPRGAALGSQRA